MSHDDLRQWHRLFGIALTDLFAGSPWRVELEKELALKSQLLDVVIIERTGDRGAVLDLPDGLEELRAHNLLTYKSQHEALDAWAVDELVGHYVNYRKLTGATGDGDLAAERDFQLLAVATRYPRKLGGEVELEASGRPGVFNLRWGARTIRLIVLERIAEHSRNAPWELFSAQMERIRHGSAHYHARSPDAHALLHELYLRYVLELPNMAYTMEDFVRESHQHVLERLSPQERQVFLARLPAEDRRAFLERLSAEDRRAFLERLPAEDRRAFLERLPAEERLRGLAAAERLRGLNHAELQQIKDLLDKLELG